MKKLFLTSLLFIALLPLYGQIVTLTPPDAGPEDPVILTFDAAAGNGELTGADKVYAHHGVVTNAPDGQDWSYVIGNWGQDDGVGEMEPVPGEPDKWQIELAPTIREYFNVPSAENIFRISAVFRSADGNTKGTIAPGEYGWGTVAPNQDYFINLNAGNFITITAPVGSDAFLDPGQDITFSAAASSEVTSLKLWIDDGSGYDEVASATSGTTIEYNYTPATTGEIGLRVTATVNGEELEVEKPFFITLIQPTTEAPLPPGLDLGINYQEDDATKVTLVLEAPGKEFVYVVGDFTDWTAQDTYQMNRTPDGELFWLEVDGLTPQQAYVFQYWVEGSVKVGDPYADQVADPWNDPWIEETVYPDLPEYDRTDYGIATVLQTGQEPYDWAPSEDTWERPDLDHLVIYELLVRDFLGSHSYADLTDTLNYLKTLGVDAIEIMPFNEFEGNESWGYNPSYYFAPDKYYGTKDALKHFIETAHQEGFAVIMDMVLNHAYGQNAMVRMYWDQMAGQPAADNPWFNAEYVGPFSWGYDFNHESDYTKAFIDRVNKYWIEEYHVDGYRFDFTKGFTNYAPGGSIDNYDVSRIDILKRMADEIWDADPDAYVILEHWGPANEEQELADYGMVMWRNRSYDYVPPVTGNNSGSFNNMWVESHVSYHNSHDERRIAEHALTEGQANGSYDVKNPLIMYERVKMAAAFTFLYPGPKMMWQFDELGYDIDINFNGRVGNKPLPWGPDGLGYYEDELRQYIYDAYVGILDVRNQIGAENMANATTNHQNSGITRRLSYDMAGTDLVVIGNFGLDTESIDPSFTQTGTWYEYFSGEEWEVINPNEAIELRAGEWHIFTTEQLSPGMPGVVEIFDSPVTIEPFPFTGSDEITVTFDATKAWPGVTLGLVDADKVYFHSGVVLDHPDSQDLDNIVGTFFDDGVGLMTEVSEDIWEITLTPKDYYGLLADQEAFKLGMWFRDATNVNQGYGFRNSIIYYNIASERPIVTIEPPAFTIDDEITITFNALAGNRELVDADKVYIHSSVDLNDTSTPHNTAWQNVVGNWGADDGVGQMSPVPGEQDLWEITLTPKDYYGLAADDHAYWVAAVFRSADGTVKGTGTPGPIENGYIHTNLDFFIENQLVVSTHQPRLVDWKVEVLPNPTDGNAELWVKDIVGDFQWQLVDLHGRILQTQTAMGPVYRQPLMLEAYPAGTYWLRVIHTDQVLVYPIVKQ